MDKKGDKQKVNDTKNVVMPAWTDDGSKLAYLEGRGRGRFALIVATVEMTSEVVATLFVRRSPRSLATGVATALAAAHLAAQTPAPQTPQFKAGVDVVEVDVSVLDKNGKPVTDLRAGDFEVRERGDLQRVDTIFLVAPMARPAGAGAARPPCLPLRQRHRRRRQRRGRGATPAAARVRLRLRYGAPLCRRLRAEPHRYPRVPERRPARRGLCRARRQWQHARQPDRQRQGRAARAPRRDGPAESDSLHRDAAVAADSDRGRGAADRAQHRERPQGCADACLQRAAGRMRRLRERSGRGRDREQERADFRRIGSRRADDADGAADARQAASAGFPDRSTSSSSRKGSTPATSPSA